MERARAAERAIRWVVTYPFRAERAERELRRLVVHTAVRLVGRRRDPRRGHAVVGVHGNASVCFRRERGRRTKGGKVSVAASQSSRVGRASRRSRLDGGVRATDASPLLGFYRRGIRAVDAPAACVTPRAWSREVGPGPPRLRVRESGSGKRQNARPGAERARGRRFAPRVTSRREAIGKWRQRRPTPVFVGGLGKSQSPFVRFVPDAPSAGDRFASVAASEAAHDSVGCGRASASVERRRRVRDGRRDVSGLRENGLRHSRRITHASGATSVRPFRSEK